MSRFDGLTGHLFEEKVLGTCKVSHRGYMVWKEALAEVCKNQPAKKAPIASNLESEVRKQVPKHIDVQFYTAVGSTLDKMHSVDGFFIFEGVVTVTIDLTKNTQKDACKADLLVIPADLDDLAALAGRVVRELTMKVARMPG